MKFTRPKHAPVVLAIVVLALVCGVRVVNPDFLEQLECKTYDLRVRTAQEYPQQVATNLAFVAMENSSIQWVHEDNLTPRGYGLYWPRHVYGRVVEELSAQGAREIAFDVLFGELRPDHAAVQMADGSVMESDDFFAVKMRQAGNVITAYTPDTTPPKLFITNSLALGDISTEKDSDGILRRVKCFNLKWNDAFRSVSDQLKIDLPRAVIEPDKILLPLPDGTNFFPVKLDSSGNFDLTNFVGDEIPKGWKRFDKPYTRIWDLGIVMAAQQLNLDLDHAVVDLPGGKIILHGPNGITRRLPVDSHGFFYINWELTADDPRITYAPIEAVLQQDLLRLADQTNNLRDTFRNRLVIIGSKAQGNDLSDRGATPLANNTFYVSKHWNVANSVIMGQFIHRTSLPMELALIVFLGALTALLTWELRALASSLMVAALLVAYTAAAVVVFVKFRWWLPLVYPLLGAVLIQHFVLVIHRVVFEEREKRRIKSVFSKLVSPNIVNEVLAADVAALNGTRREVTIFFADVRGFTTLTDQTQEQIAEFIRHSDVDLLTAEKYVEASAREMLEVVNLYLAAVADVIKSHGGTLDKYIGDCVMAFWNAPTPHENHALACVQAAIDAQRAIQVLNEERQAQNPARDAENRARISAGLPPRPMHVSLQLGTGINTGFVTAGFMGSDDHILNYTVFGREVNLASRLEGESGSGRIIISDTTYHHLLRSSPALASTCVELFPVKPDGFLNPVRIYEVPWKKTGA